MRIGVMLRSLGEKGGIGVYAENLTQEMLEVDSENGYVLLYRSRENLAALPTTPTSRSGGCGWRQAGLGPDRHSPRLLTEAL